MKKNTSRHLVYLVSVLFNLINVWMEEGVFRGLFKKSWEGISSPRSILYSLPIWNMAFGNAH